MSIKTPIKMVDLTYQQQLISAQLNNAIFAVLNKGNYILGEQVEELEQQLAIYCGAKFAISCANGTDALTLVLRAKQVGKKDAIFVPAFTFTATAEAVVLAGATPVFVDVLPDSFNLDPKSLEEAINIAKIKKLNPTGIIPVDLFGLPADYRTIYQIAAQYNLWILSDAAQSFGASYFDKKVGVLGMATATSFFPSKPLGCYGDGGCIFTDDADLAAILRSLRVHGAKIENGVMDKYNNVRIGFNSRLDTLQAAILLEKLKIFPTEIEQRNRIAKNYNKLLKNLSYIDVPVMADNITSAWAQYTIKLNNSNILTNKQLQSKLAQFSIPTVIYYSMPISEHEPYLNFIRNSLTVSKNLSKVVLSLPMHPYLSLEQQNYIVNKLQEIFHETCVV